MSGFHFAQDETGGHGSVCFGLGTASENYDHGDPVMITSDRLVETPRDGTEALQAEFIGFAFESAIGATAASRAAVATGVFEAASPGLEHGDIGAGADRPRSYLFYDPNMILWTPNFWVTAAAGTQQTIASGDLYQFRQISATSAGVWGIEDTAGVAGTDVVAQILWYTGPRGVPLGATATTAATDDIKIYFRITNPEEFPDAGMIRQ